MNSQKDLKNKLYQHAPFAKRICDVPPQRFLIMDEAVVFGTAAASPLYYLNNEKKGHKEDPIPGGAEGLADTVNTLHRIGYRNVTSIVYSGMKHEVLNEEGRQQVYEDILAFLQG